MAYWNKYVGYLSKNVECRLRKTFATVRWLGHKAQGWKKDVKVQIIIDRRKGSFSYKQIQDKGMLTETTSCDIIEVFVPDLNMNHS